MSEIEYVSRGTGRIAVEVSGEGPLVLCIPGIGDLRSSFRHIVPGLVASGYRVAAMDLRGHGDSSADFDAYDGASTAGDALAVVQHLGADTAVIVGNSMGADAAVVAAAQSPSAVAGLVLIGPFVRDAGGTFSRVAFRLALARPWGRSVWRSYFAKLFVTDPVDLAQHKAAVEASLARPGRWRAFQRTATASHAGAEAATPQVRADVLVVMGERDPDWKDAAAEARWVANRLDGSVRMIPDAGHYPQAERPGLVLDAVIPFLAQNVPAAERGR
ncbi:alpha/beta hydrolase [Brooklawnia cerclae]|uniref:Pimeloyl-ACP methyl ester carboxylesterase n=1 Tax=Brooklawnia cerclae TaxID=349934 RepID=A0ABX0SHG1_9ACTN|nr:alpha/beta hydrolase [Brooklawnia cerclae]NIH57842.1 pimeloyl-ACP methyl ester carboxylesterase [Brooklawnia cerclae]